MKYGTGKIRKGLEVEDGEESDGRQWLGKRVEFRFYVESEEAEEAGVFQNAKGRVVRQKFLGYVTDGGERQQEYELTIARLRGDGEKTAVVRAVNNYVRLLPD